MNFNNISKFKKLLLAFYLI